MTPNNISKIRHNIMFSLKTVCSTLRVLREHLRVKFSFHVKTNQLINFKRARTLFVKRFNKKYTIIKKRSNKPNRNHGKERGLKQYDSTFHVIFNPYGK